MTVAESAEQTYHAKDTASRLGGTERWFGHSQGGMGVHLRGCDLRGRARRAQALLRIGVKGDVGPPQDDELGGKIRGQGGFPNPSFSSGDGDDGLGVQSQGRTYFQNTEFINFISLLCDVKPIMPIASLPFGGPFLQRLCDPPGEPIRCTSPGLHQ